MNLTFNPYIWIAGLLGLTVKVWRYHPRGPVLRTQIIGGVVSLVLLTLYGMDEDMFTAIISYFGSQAVDLTHSTKQVIQRYYKPSNKD